MNTLAANLELLKALAGLKTVLSSFRTHFPEFCLELETMVFDPLLREVAVHGFDLQLPRPVVLGANERWNKFGISLEFAIGQIQESKVLTIVDRAPAY